MKLSDPSFLNMDKILKNLSDFMKRPPAPSGPKNHPRVERMKRFLGRDGSPSGPKIQARMRRLKKCGRLAHIVPNLRRPVARAAYACSVVKLLLFRHSHTAPPRTSRMPVAQVSGSGTGMIWLLNPRSKPVPRKPLSNPL